MFVKLLRLRVCLLSTQYKAHTHTHTHIHTHTYTHAQVQDKLSGDKAAVVIACFLVQEGAEMFITNKKGRTALEMAAGDLRSVVMGFGQMSR